MRFQIQGNACHFRQSVERLEPNLNKHRSYRRRPTITCPKSRYAYGGGAPRRRAALTRSTRPAPCRCRSGDGQGSEVFRGRLPQDQLVQRQVRHPPDAAGRSPAKAPSPFDLIRLHPAERRRQWKYVVSVTAIVFTPPRSTCLARSAPQPGAAWL